MAYRKKRTSRAKKKSSVTNPTQTQINLLLDGDDTNRTVIRTDKVLSQMNHQLFRQSRNYCVKLDLDPTEDISIDVFALVDTWWLRKAYKLAKETFDKNSAEELGQLKTMKARWNDFRVDHGLGLLFQTELVAAGALSPGTWTTYTGNQEYQLTEVHDASGLPRTFRFLGSGAGTFNIIDEYDRTGNVQSAPSNAVDDIAYDGLEDNMDDGQMQHLSEDGQIPPYDRLNFENYVLVRVATLTATGMAGGYAKLSTGYFNAPAGIIALQATNNFTEQQLTLSVKEGDYKGVHAPSMLE